MKKPTITAPGKKTRPARLAGGARPGAGRPRKNGSAAGRLHAGAWLPAETLRQLDGYVESLQKPDSPVVSRGDVIASALKAFKPLRRWVLKNIWPVP
jgi:hypothetical protein